jgi:thymidylate synthase ThyX
MTIEAKIIADSVSSEGIRLTTFQLRYPRFIHAEVMTHRVFSRNASSSRAVPVERLIADIEQDPAMPIHWGKNQKGMQAYEELSDTALAIAQNTWKEAMWLAVGQARRLAGVQAHKQLVNRVLEPFAHINVVLTATDFANFYALRCHPYAQPEIQILANEMRLAQDISVPRKLKPLEWHTPYYGDGTWIQNQNRTEECGEMRDVLNNTLIDALKVSTARCARVSYKTFEGKYSTVQDDIALCNKLLADKPLHASPAEHQATPDEQWLMGQWYHPDQHGNFRGWRQHRKLLACEHVPG